MTPSMLRRARLSDPAQYAETITALLLTEVGNALPYAIRGHAPADAGAIAAVHDLESVGLVRRAEVLCDGTTVQIAERLGRVSADIRRAA